MKSSSLKGKFFDALQSHQEQSTQALQMIQEMYAVEDECAQLDDAARLAYRLVHLAPKFKAFEEWIEGYRNKAIPKNLFATAIRYALNHWPETAPMLQDGRIRLDNNGIENAVRILALGRKNYLFAGSHGAAKNIAVFYSLIASCKALDVNPRDYLNDVLGKLMSWPVNRMHELLPAAYVKAKKQELIDVVG